MDLSKIRISVTVNLLQIFKIEWQDIGFRLPHNLLPPVTFSSTPALPFISCTPTTPTTPLYLPSVLSALIFLLLTTNFRQNLWNQNTPSPLSVLKYFFSATTLVSHFGRWMGASYPRTRQLRLICQYNHPPTPAVFSIALQSVILSSYYPRFQRNFQQFLWQICGKRARRIDPTQSQQHC